jgi:hypothetical protein
MLPPEEKLSELDKALMNLSDDELKEWLYQSKIKAFSTFNSFYISSNFINCEINQFKHRLYGDMSFINYYLLFMNIANMIKSLRDMESLHQDYIWVTLSNTFYTRETHIMKISIDRAWKELDSLLDKIPSRGL